ncbi:MAG: DUF167 domain-containing protein [Alphaproteobacteria bacterium]|nr:DUF167 domain-containing protein [Alphaproteobacteria bacterium]
MQIKVRVLPRARQNSITESSDGILRVHTTAVPDSGRANEAVIKLLAKHLDVPKSQIKIIRGETSHDKLIEY